MSISLTKPAVGSTGWGAAVNQNWTDIENAINNNSSTAPGVVSLFGGSSVPSGWLECDGSTVSRSTYAALFSAIGTTWGAGDGSTTFNLPDLRGRAPIGVGQGSGLSNRTLGSSGGEETHTLSTGEMPTHSHVAGSGQAFGIFFTPGTGVTYPIGGGSGSGYLYSAMATSTGSAGSGNAHNNMQPWAALKFIIKS